MIKNIHLLVLCFVCNMIYAGNIQQQDSTYQKQNMLKLSVIDSCMVNEIGKTNANIILYADSIIAKTIAWEGCKEESIRLPENMSDIIKYTFCAPSMYLSNKKVYASFQPYLTLTFYKGNNNLSIQFDYDINKWMIKSDNNDIICHDLKNSSLLPLFFLLFQNNPLIEKSYKKLLQ